MKSSTPHVRPHNVFFWLLGKEIQDIFAQNFLESSLYITLYSPIKLKMAKKGIEEKFS